MRQQDSIRLSDTFYYRMNPTSHMFSYLTMCSLLIEDCRSCLSNDRLGVWWLGDQVVMVC